MNFLPIILLFIGGMVLTVGDIFMKKWVAVDRPVFYIVGMIIYLIGLNFLAQSFKYKNIAVASVIFVAVNVITLSLVSWWYFKESLSLLQILGIVVGLASIVILEIAD